MEQYYRDTWAEIDLSCIANNVRRIKRHFRKHIMAVVKANGYGHGAPEVARAAIDAGATYLGVAILDEAIQLRKSGITEPILVLGLARPEDVSIACDYDITLTAFQLSWLMKAKEFIPLDKTLNLHVKFDTGMGRIGITDKEEGKHVINAIKESKEFMLEGVYTHFATADELDLSYFNKQYERFLAVLSWLAEWKAEPVYIHCGNSATGLRFPEKSFNMFRLGISMYGLTPSPEIKDMLPVKLEEAFSLHTHLIHVKRVPPNEGISYGSTYVTSDWEWIGTIPIGYADGWYRYHAAQGGQVLINGQRVPHVGRICMDQCMIKLPKEFEIGTKVTLIGVQNHDAISIDEVAKRLGTINYEIPCMISYRVPRIYCEGKQRKTVKNHILT